MLRIENKDKLIGQTIITGKVGNLIVWTVEGMYDYGPDGQYQIQLRTNSNEDDKVFILSKEEGFVEGNANYKIKDVFEPFNSVWVREDSISSVSSMIRTLKRIISHTAII